LQLQRDAYGRRHVLGQRLADQLMPEQQLVPRVDQQTAGHRLAHHRQQPGGRQIHDHRQIRDLQPRTQHRRHLEYLPGLAGQELQPAHDRPGQRLWHRSRPTTARDRRRGQLRHSVGGVDPPVPPQGGDQLVDVQRVAGRAGHQLQQRRPRCRAGQQLHQPSHRGIVERTQRQRRRAARVQAAHQLLEFLLPWDRPAGGHHEQRQLPDRAAQPMQHQQARRIGPLQVVEQQRRRALRTPLLQAVEDLFGDREIGVDQGGQLRCRLGLPGRYERRDPRRPRTGSRRRAIQARSDRGERYPLLHLLRGTTQDPHPELATLGGHDIEQRALADARLTLQQHRAALPAHGLLDEYA
jgi:hypothetical protein